MSEILVDFIDAPNNLRQPLLDAVGAKIAEQKAALLSTYGIEVI